jgi:hypothetical protein
MMLLLLLLTTINHDNRVKVIKTTSCLVVNDVVGLILTAPQLPLLQLLPPGTTPLFPLTSRGDIESIPNYP